MCTLALFVTTAFATASLAQDQQGKGKRAGIHTVDKAF